MQKKEKERVWDKEVLLHFFDVLLTIVVYGFVICSGTWDF